MNLVNKSVYLSTTYKKLIKFVDKAGGVVAGSFPVSLVYEQMTASDIDVFCKDDECFNKLLGFLELTCDKVKETKYAITFKYPDIDEPIQLIRPSDHGITASTKGNPEQLLREFDFTICQAYIKDENTVAITDKAIDAIEKKRFLLKNAGNNPVYTIIRALKYARKGFMLEPLSVVILLNRWMDLTEDERLEIQKLAEEEYKDLLNSKYEAKAVATFFSKQAYSRESW